MEWAVGPLGDGEPAILRVAVPPPDPDAVAAARRAGFSIAPLKDGTAYLSVTRNGPLSSEQFRLLEPLRLQITWLDLGRSSIGDRDLAIIARLPHLTRLSLHRTGATDAGLAQLTPLRHLEYLNLYGTSVTDAGLAHLENLPSLHALYLWQTAVTPAGVERLRVALPRLSVNAGAEPSTADSSGALAERARLE